MFEEAKTNPFGLLQHWKRALVESKDAIEWLATNEAIDPLRLGVLGYSLGSYIGLQTAAGEKRVKCVVVAAGGDLPETPWTSMVRMVTDPLTAAKFLKTRPLLVLHGTNDRTIQFAGQHQFLRFTRNPSAPGLVDAVVAVEGGNNFSEDFSGTVGAAISKEFAGRGAV